MNPLGKALSAIGGVLHRDRKLGSILECEDANVGGFRFTVQRPEKLDEEGNVVAEQKDYDQREDLEIAVRVTGAEKAKDHKKDTPHVKYVIKVSVNKSGVSWIVQRRYKAFVRLHEELAKFVPKEKLPAMPGKSVTRSFKTQYIEQKRLGLELYLSQLAQLPEVASSEAGCSFLVGSLSDLLYGMMDNQAEQKAGAAALKTVQEESEELAAELERAEATLEKMKKQAKLLQEQNEVLKGECEAKSSYQQQVAELTAQLQNITIQSSETSHLQEEIQAAQDALVANNMKWESQVATLAQQLEMFKNEKHQLEESHLELAAQVKQLKSQKKVLIAEVRQQRQAMQESGVIMPVASPRLTSASVFVPSPSSSGPTDASSPISSPASASSPPNLSSL